MSRHGVRAEWGRIPATVKAEVEAIAGAKIVAARNIGGGFSPGPAARCDLADGRTVFVKAAGSELNPDSPQMHRREAVVLGVLPSLFPSSEMIGLVDDGDWVALVITWIDATMPFAPLDRTAIERVLTLAHRVSDLGREVDTDRLPACADAHAELGGNWRELRNAAVLDRWTHEHLDELANMEADFAVAIDGDCLVHFDLRTDNILLGATECDDVVVDWPGACSGAPWIDLAALLPSLHLDGGPLPHDVFEHHPVGRAAEPESVDVFLAALAGYFTRRSLLPPPTGLPTLRPFQAEQGRVTREWLRARRF